MKIRILTAFVAGVFLSASAQAGEPNTCKAFLNVLAARPSMIHPVGVKAAFTDKKILQAYQSSTLAVPGFDQPAGTAASNQSEYSSQRFHVGSYGITVPNLPDYHVINAEKTLEISTRTLTGTEGKGKHVEHLIVEVKEYGNIASLDCAEIACADWKFKTTSFVFDVANATDGSSEPICRLNNVSAELTPTPQNIRDSFYWGGDASECSIMNERRAAFRARPLRTLTREVLGFTSQAEAGILTVNNKSWHRQSAVDLARNACALGGPYFGTPKPRETTQVEQPKPLVRGTAATTE